ncbi:MAG: MBOAT family protein [Oscillospiraceae bacterium]|nr:MBOAT family protein [Oscillospiraceae bacterium]
MGFYAWACFDNVFFLLIIIVATYAAGQLIRRWQDARAGEPSAAPEDRLRAVTPGAFLCGLMTVFLLAVLYHYKYAGTWKMNVWDIHVIPVITPLGLSFLVFSVISYLVDVYRGCHAGDFLDVAVYISFFPKIISGPIVTWKQWQGIGETCQMSVDNACAGVERIVVGLAKKVILADYFGSVIHATNYDWQSAWLISILYTFQIYFDFSGYSDIAIGIARYVGLRFEENFNFPYSSVSITEFWKRWHISLGAWLREYVYIPLGGNRKGKRRTLINLFIVMLVSGVWHGAGLGYLAWGAMHGACMVIERIVRDKKWYKKIPSCVKWLVTMFIVMVGWQFFRANSLSDAITHVGRMFNIGTSAELTFTWQYYVTPKLIAMLVIAFVGSTVFRWIQDLIQRKEHQRSKSFQVIQMVLSLCLFAVTLICITNTTYSPFIYFQY